MNLSIIIPLYNVAAYIDRCLISIKSQESFDFDWEVILIDDGSTDETKSKLIPYLDDNIKYYFQENKGAGTARNHGLERARGMHIWFVDADDFIEPGSFAQIATAFKREGAEVTLGFGYYRYVNQTNLKTLGYTCAKDDRKRYQAIEYLYSKPYYLWNLIMLKNVIDTYNIRFIDGIKNIEDFEFALKYFDKAGDCIYIDFQNYNYCDNLLSTSRERSRANLLKLAEDSYMVHKTINEQLKNGLYNNQKAVLYKLQHSILGYFFSLITINYTKKDCRDGYKLYKKSGLLEQLKTEVGLPIKFKLFKFIVTNRILFELLLILRNK